MFFLAEAWNEALAVIGEEVVVFSCDITCRARAAGSVRNRAGVTIGFKNSLRTRRRVCSLLMEAIAKSCVGLYCRVFLKFGV